MSDKPKKTARNQPGPGESVGQQGSDDFERFKFISETHRKLHDERRKYEVRYLIGLITLLVLSVASVLGGQVQLAELGVIGIVLAWVLLLGISTIASAYLWFIHHSNRRNKNIAARAERAIALGDYETDRQTLASEIGIEIRKLDLDEGIGGDATEAKGESPGRLACLVAACRMLNYGWKGQVVAIMVFAVIAALLVTASILSSSKPQPAKNVNTWKLSLERPSESG